MDDEKINYKEVTLLEKKSITVKTIQKQHSIL